MRTKIVSLVLLMSLLVSLFPAPRLAAAPLGEFAGRGQIDSRILTEMSASADGQASYIVYLQEQADLRAAYYISDWQERGEYVYQTLTDVAARTQADLRQTLTQTPHESFWIVNALKVTSDRATLDRVAAHKGIERIDYIDRIALPRPVDTTELTLETTPGDIAWGVAKINAPAVWADGVTGAGIVVANIDTGVDYDHEALRTQYRGYMGDGSYAHDYNWYDVSNTLSAPADWHDHGSHTIGTIIGDNGAVNPDDRQQIGVAPGAQWIAARGFATDDATEDELLRAAQWILAPTPVGVAPGAGNGNPARRPHIVSNSWGEDVGGTYNPWLTATVEAWRAAGIYPVFSGGNSGSNCGTVSSPGDYPNVTGVGSTNSSDGISGFSSRGPSSAPDGGVKPDLSAPGESIYSANHSGSYRSMSGTSMAAPHVAGVVALLWSADPDLIGNFDLTEKIMRESAVHLTSSQQCGGIPGAQSPNNTFGYGRIDARAAVDRVQTIGELNGYVRDEQDDAIVGAVIKAVGADDSSTIAYSDAQGWYRLPLLPDTYSISVQAQNYAPVSFAATITAAEVEHLNVMLMPAQNSVISGQISDAENAAPLWATITIADGQNVDMTIYSDWDTGRYSVTLPSGIYEFTVSSPLHQPIARTVSAPAPASVDFALPRQNSCTLLVDDDKGEAYESYYRAALETAGIGYDYWNVQEQDSPTAETLRLYDRVVWFTGDDYSTTLSSADQDALAAYLDGGGNLFLSGQDIGYDIYNSTFYRDYLRATYLDDEAYSSQVLGQGEFISITLELNGADGAANQFYPSIIAPADEQATCIFQYADSTDCGGVMVYTDTYKVVYLAFGLEGAGATATRAETIARAFALFDDCTPRGAIVGQVREHNQGAGLPGAVITANGAQTVSDAAGYYSLPLLPGSYTITVALADVDAQTVANVVVNAMEFTRQDFTLNAPVLDFAPTSFNMRLPRGAFGHETLTVSNVGSAELAYQLQVADADYLRVTPDAGTVAPGATAEIAVQGDATAVSAGTYNSALYLTSTDPRRAPAEIPMTLIVHENDDFAVLRGAVTSAEAGTPLAATILLSGAQTGAFATSAYTGMYARTLLPGEYTVTAMAAGYVSETAQVALDIGAAKVQDFVLPLRAPQLGLNPAAFTVTVSLGEIVTRQLHISNTGNAALSYELHDSERDFNPIPLTATLPTQNSAINTAPAPRERAEKYDPAARSTEGQYLTPEDAVDNVPAEAADIKFQFDPDLTTPWGIGIAEYTVWVGDAETNVNVQFDLAGAPTGEMIETDWGGEWAADMAWDANHDLLWQVNVGGDNCLYGVTTPDGAAAERICHDTWTATSQRAVAYDHDTDTFYIGGWNDDTIYHVAGLDWAEPGAILDEVDFSDIAGLAWHGSGYLYVATNNQYSKLYKVDPLTGDEQRVIQFPGDSYYGGAGVEFDEECNLWVANQADGQVYQLDLGEPGECGKVADAPWLREAPPNGIVPINGTAVVTVTFDSTAVAAPGSYAGYIIANADDPHSPTVKLPVEFNVAPSADIGRFIGAVRDARAPEPLRATLTATNDLYTYTITCDRAGAFDSWLKAGSYRVQISAAGYVTTEHAITIAARGTVSYAFTMPPDAPWMQVAAAELAETREFGTIGAYTTRITITNQGAQPLDFVIQKLPRQIRAATASAFNLAAELDSVPRLTRESLYGKEKIDPSLSAQLTRGSRITAQGAKPLEFIVVFKDRADLRRAYDIADWNTRGQFVLDALRKVAAESQAETVALLDAAKSTGTVQDYRSYYIVNAVLVRGAHTAALADLAYTLAARADVAYLRGNYRQATVPPQPGVAEATVDDVEWGIALVRADEVWNELGITGAGAVVANIDSGVRWTHNALKSHYRGWNGATVDHNYNWWDPSGTFPAEPGDQDGHGTHTMGTMIGSDGVSNFVGVAPGAQWIATSGCHTCADDDLLESGEWIIAPWDLSGDTATADPARRPHVVNNSWGSTWAGDPDTWYLETVEAWRAAGIFPSWSAGNAGDEGCGSVSAPGNYNASFSSGAIDSSSELAYFSSLGPSPFADGEVKPNVVAPGVNVRSSYNGNDDDYATASGTSMASPHTAGVVALLIAANPDLVGNIAAIEDTLMEAAQPVASSVCGAPTEVPNYAYGWGILDAYEAVARVAMRTDWLLVEPLTGTVAPGDSVGVQVAFDARAAAPGVHGASLSINGNDPYSATMRLPVTLTVQPTADMGVLRGVVTDKATGLPLPANIEVANAYAVRASAETGEYSGYYLAGTYHITVTMSGYVSQTATVQIAAQATITQNFALIPDVAVLQLAPTSIESELSIGAQVQIPLTLTNAGARDLTYALQIPVDEMMVEESDAAGGLVYQWIDATGGAPLYLSDDDYEQVDLPAPFSFYGEEYAEIFVGSNGLVAFGVGSSSYGNRSIPYANLPNNFLAAFWDDLNPGNDGNIYTLAHDDYFVIEYHDVRHYGGDARETFEVILDYATGDILFQYQTVSDDDSCTVGVENADGTAGLEYCYNTAGCLHDELALRFYENATTQEWLSVAPISGVVASETDAVVQVQLDARALTAPGVYEGRIQLDSNDRAQPQVFIPVQMVLGASIDLAVTQVLPEFIGLGKVITYEVRCINVGASAATGVQLTDWLPEEIEYRGDNSGFYHLGGSTGPIIWDVGELGAHSGRSFIVTAQVVGTGLGMAELQSLLGRQITNTLSIAAAQMEGNTANNTHAAPMMLAEPDVSIEIHSPGAADPGEVFQYTITYANWGYADAYNIYITETLPAEIEFIEDNSGLFRQMPTRDQVVWWMGTLPMQTEKTFTVTAQVRADAELDTMLTRAIQIRTATREFITMNNSETMRMMIGEWRVFIPAILKGVVK